MGLSLTELKFSAGEARMIFGILGAALLLFAKNRSSFAGAFMLGWFFSITLMSLRPNWLFIDIPSNRIASYIGFPVAILAGFAIVKILSAIRESGKQFMASQVVFSIFLVLLTFIAVSGLYDNSQTLNIDGKPESALQTYHASEYLAEVSDDSDMVLKDHNYLLADSWMKLNFMRGYNYPLSRGFFKRYSDETKPREQCTNLMISTPSNADAQKCFEGTKTNFLMVNPKLDATQFQKSKDFWQVYSAEDIAIFHKVP
ncbi:MAG: hypothetical protein ACD_67C00245G0001 [uncultured bacterium]|nr:MAG: hypothetical protein ACD_67C00245G0001 [uncultured bacterium]